MAVESIGDDDFAAAKQTATVRKPLAREDVVKMWRVNPGPFSDGPMAMPSPESGAQAYLEAGRLFGPILAFVRGHDRIPLRPGRFLIGSA